MSVLLGIKLRDFVPSLQAPYPLSHIPNLSLCCCFTIFYLHSHFTYIYFAFTLYVYLHYLLLYVDVCICVHMHAMTRVWRSEDHLEELFLSFYHVGARDGTQMVRLSGKRLYLQSHVVGSRSF